MKNKKLNEAEFDYISHFEDSCLSHAYRLANETDEYIEDVKKMPFGRIGEDGLLHEHGTISPKYLAAYYKSMYEDKCELYEKMYNKIRNIYDEF